MKIKFIKRSLCAFLSGSMIFSCMSMSAFANEIETVIDETEDDIIEMESVIEETVFTETYVIAERNAASKDVVFVANAMVAAHKALSKDVVDNQFIQAYEDMKVAQELAGSFTDKEFEEVRKLAGDSAGAYVKLNMMLYWYDLSDVYEMYVPYTAFVQNPNRSTAKAYYDAYIRIIKDLSHNMGTSGMTVRRYISDITQVFKETAQYLPLEDVVIVYNNYLDMKKALESGKIDKAFMKAYDAFPDVWNMFITFSDAKQGALRDFTGTKGSVEDLANELDNTWMIMACIYETNEVYSAFKADKNKETATELVSVYDEWFEKYSDATKHLYKFFKDIDVMYAEARALSGNPLDVPFVDVATNKWYYNSVKWAYEKGLLTGTSDYEFSPNDPMTRGMLVTVLYRMEGRPAVGWSALFPDVKSNKYYAKAIEWAASNDLVSGYTNGNFGPEDSITREQIAKILYLYADYKEFDTTNAADISSYKDAAKVSGYAKKYMQWAVAEGLIKGSNGELNPKGNATRAEIAAILKRFVEKYEVQ